MKTLTETLNTKLDAAATALASKLEQKILSKRAVRSFRGKSWLTQNPGRMLGQT